LGGGIVDKRFMAILAGLVIIFIGAFAFSQHSSNKSSSNSSGQPTNHIEGQGQKKVTLVEYGDYQCSACEGFSATVKQVFAQYSSDITLQFRNLPLTSLHPNAFAAARAAEAASMQNKFWQMHDLLYDPTNWQAWTSASNPVPLFDTYAQQLELDVNKFKSDYSSEQVNSLINADMAAFKKTKQEQATPTYFLDGKVLDNSKLVDQQTGQPSFDKFSQVIANEIASKK
jgi:protein-disulfide isomerase